MVEVTIPEVPEVPVSGRRGIPEKLPETREPYGFRETGTGAGHEC